MLISCPQCHTEFTWTRHNPKFCSDECHKAARTRTCKYCGKPFTVRYLTKKTEAHRECHLAAKLPEIVAALRTRRAAGRVTAPCGWGDKCLFPGVPVSVTKSKADRHKHHPECWEARGRYAGGTTGKGRGKVLWCQKCGCEIGYRTPSGLGQKLCRECASVSSGTHSRVKSGEWHPCPVCGTQTYLKRSQMEAGKPGCCSPTCGYAWRRAHSGTKALTCQGCGVVKRFPATHLPRSITRGGATWTCAACRQPKTGYQERTCEHCQKSFRARIRLAKPEASRFCSLACRHDHYKEVRRRRGPCAQCGGPIKRRGANGKHCSWACEVAARQGKPHPRWRPSPAEVRVLEQWTAGVRGVRPLARAAGVADTTVRNMKAAGKLVESAAARSA